MRSKSNGMLCKEIELKIDKVYEIFKYGDKDTSKDVEPLFIKIVHILPPFEKDEDESKSWKTAIGISVYKDFNGKWCQRSYSYSNLYDSKTGQTRDDINGLQSLVQIEEEKEDDKWLEEADKEFQRQMGIN